MVHVWFPRPAGTEREVRTSGKRKEMRQALWLQLKKSECATRQASAAAGRLVGDVVSDLSGGAFTHSWNSTQGCRLRPLPAVWLEEFAL